MLPEPLPGVCKRDQYRKEKLATGPKLHRVRLAGFPPDR
jgi:hypothetical protein